jgi:hypothetical protein
MAEDSQRQFANLERELAVRTPRMIEVTIADDSERITIIRSAVKSDANASDTSAQVEAAVYGAPQQEDRVRVESANPANRRGHEL